MVLQCPDAVLHMLLRSHVSFLKSVAALHLCKLPNQQCPEQRGSRHKALLSTKFCASMPQRAFEPGNPFFADLEGQELGQILPQLTQDVRHIIATKLSSTQRARCLLLTSSGTRQKGSASLLDDLEATHKYGQWFRQLQQVDPTRSEWSAKASEVPEIPVFQTSFSAYS